jgi:hypothetical protein
MAQDPGTRDQVITGPEGDFGLGPWKTRTHCVMGGHGLSHPQEQPLTSAGRRGALAKTEPCGQLGSRTANRMGRATEPFR